MILLKAENAEDDPALRRRPTKRAYQLLMPREENTMKILLSADAYMNLINGVTVVVKTLYDTYTAQGHDVRILTMSGDREEHHEGDIYFLPSVKVPLYPDVRLSFVKRHPYLEELKEWRPDVVHIHTEGPASKLARSIARASDAPVVMTWHTDYAKFAFHNRSSLKLVEWSTKKLMRVAYKGATMITVPSYKAKALLDGYKLRNPNVVIPNGIILERFTKELSEDEKKKLLEKLGIGSDKKLLVIVSRLSGEKNISEILKYFPSVLKEEPKAHLLIAGRGPDQKHLEHLTQKLGLTEYVTFPGFVPHDETYKYYKLGMVFLSASTFEMHSLTYLEATACGLPLVCRDDPSIQGVLIDGENGFAYHDEKEFTEDVLRILNDDSLRAEMSERSLSISREYSEQAFSDNMLSLYQRLVDEKKKTQQNKD